MKPTAIVALLAFAFTATVVATPMPPSNEAPGFADESSHGTLAARDPLYNMRKKLFPGASGYKKRDTDDDEVDEVDESEYSVLEARDPLYNMRKKLFPGASGYKI